ncbi:MAG: hypothetical protein Fur0016_26950 [Anaerolineales bacterium]
MLETLRFAFSIFGEAFQKRDLRSLFHQHVFYQRVAVPIVIDLDALPFSKEPFDGAPYRCIELERQAILISEQVFFKRTRRFDALRHLKQGLRGFGLRDETGLLVGDMWCAFPGSRVARDDLGMLGLSCEPDSAYALDMFIAPEYRGQKLAVPLHQSVQLTLKRAGWRKLYAYYWEDNRASRWMHWMLKCTELPKRRVSRFFWLKITHAEKE